MDACGLGGQLHVDIHKKQCGTRRLSGKFSTLRPEGGRFESHSSHYVRDLGQVLHSQLPVGLWRVNSDTVSML